MDEPTTHLDVGSIDALIGALQQYEGTLIFISHDVYFIKAIATSVLHISAGKLTAYPGNYDYYLDKSRALSARSALTAGEKLHNDQPTEAAAADRAPAGPGMREQREKKRAEAEARKAQAAERRELEKRVHALEARILALECRQKELTAELEKPESYTPGGNAMALNRDLMTVAEDLEKVNAEWEAAAAKMG
jgi:ATP-binding cassette subfamily F protein 3